MSSYLDFQPDEFGIYEYVPGVIVDIPCAIRNMPMSVYHGQPCVGPSISSSQLRTIFSQSLKHYWDKSPLNPDREPFQDTEATILGRAAHHLFLGEADFSKYFVVSKYAEFRSNEAKEWRAEQQLNGLTILTAKQVECIKGMANSLMLEEPVRGGILNGHVELSMFYPDPETGIWVKSRPDAVPNDADGADMKCVADIFDEGISRGLGDRGYHQQAALTFEAVRHVFHRSMENFFLVYVEQKRPHCVRINTIHPDDVADGIVENQAALRLFARALQTNEWPGPKGEGGDGSFVRRTTWTREWAKRRLKQIEQDLSQ
ncbi:PD-(D/E)XK nuclease-like domain-containing protein [Shinella zoogloeoides]|uniref:PD-(D/E)XK nuclease-like domain-containing protein n=1 Tax=Shinella zoogloeoides TaxID=352475 RepID=UPI00299ED755|nr:PD-(D/E)XK nuclease-like domain-containing protein [Shinella zoogloeoides]WPE19872.1 Exodeoxyribonuclease 8 [Shinella zoogloeoides]